MAHHSKIPQGAGVPVGAAVIIAAIGVMLGAMLAAALLPAKAPVQSGSRAVVVPEKADIPAEAPGAPIVSFAAPVVSVRADGFVVALPDMPHRGRAVPTVVVRVTADTTFAARVPKSAQELDQPAGAAVPDTSKGLPPPPKRSEKELYKDMPLTLAGLMADDVVRIETTDVVGAKDVTASSVTLIFRPTAPVAAGAAPVDGSLPPPSGIDPVPVKNGR